MAYLRCNVGAIKPHHKQLAHGPFRYSATVGVLLRRMTYRSISSQTGAESMLSGVKDLFILTVHFSRAHAIVVLEALRIVLLQCPMILIWAACIGTQSGRPRGRTPSDLGLPIIAFRLKTKPTANAQWRDTASRLVTPSELAHNLRYL